jgi:hypothetical protein
MQLKRIMHPFDSLRSLRAGPSSFEIMQLILIEGVVMF